MATNPLDLLRMRKMALAGANRRPAAAAFLDMAGQTGQAPQAPMPSIAEGARLRALKALGASQQPTPAITRPRLLTPTSAASGAGSMMPGRGTPGSAALGAFGSTMSQLGGWQDKPMTFGQILGASLGKAREAYGTAEERQRKIAAEKAAAERQAEQDELSRRNIESQIEVRERPAGAVSAAGKFATDMGFTPGTKEHIAAMQNYMKKEKATQEKAIPWKQQTVKDPKTGKTGKADVAFLPLNSPLISALGGDPKTGRVVREGSFIADESVSKENIRTVTGVGVVDFSDKEDPKILMKSEDPRRYQNLGTYRLDGKSIGEGTLDRNTGKRYIEQPDGTKMPIPVGAVAVTEGMAAMGIPQFPQFKKIYDQLNEDEVSMRNYANYLKNIETANQGVARLADDFTSYIKTFLSTNAKEFGLTEQELALRISQGQMQGLLGSARIETVGGGVMTEQDALRVIENLGGNVNALQSKAVVKAQISRMFAQKYKGYEKNILAYNNAVNSLYSERGYDPMKPIEVDARLFDSKILSEMGVDNITASGNGAEPDVKSPAEPAPPGVEAEVWAVMTPEERALFND